MLTLGINYSQMHDSSACIVRDGQTLFAVAEERLSREKHDARFPARAIQACLDFAGVKASELDFVCFGWQPPSAAFLHDLRDYFTGTRSFGSNNLLNSTRHFAAMHRQGGGEKPFLRNFGPTRAQFRFVDHHLAHAISSYAFSGFDDAAVLVIDGRGAWEATSLWRGSGGRIEHVFTIPWPNSLGLLYAQFTQYLGFAPYSDEWKVMGLAPYGEPGVNLAGFVNPNDNPYRVNTKRLLGRDAAPTAGIEELLGPSRVPESEIGDRYKNVAYAIQDACETTMFALVRSAVEKTKSRNVCLAGGVALNSKANGKILASGLVDQLFVQPAASDDGVALGAALGPYLDTGGKLPNRAMRHAYLGPAFDDQAVESVLRTYKLRYTHLDDVAS